jgi:hypothetical protein
LIDQLPPLENLARYLEELLITQVPPGASFVKRGSAIEQVNKKLN